MTTFSDVLDLAQAASYSLTTIEDSARSRALSHFTLFENGMLTYGELRNEMLSQARAGFAAAGSIAAEHMRGIAAESGISAFDTPFLRKHEVLERILADVVRNMEVFRDSERGETELRRLRFRTWLSIQAAVQFGFTVNQLESAKKLGDMGAHLKKVWLCNFTDNTPCETCLWLHGREIDIEDEFPHGHHSKEPGCYYGLMGPPRHPNCHCYMLVYVVTLETAHVIPEAPAVVTEKFMSSRDVRRLPKAVFVAAVATLRIIAGKLRGAVRGKR